MPLSRSTFACIPFFASLAVADPSACTGVASLKSVSQVHTCINSLLEAKVFEPDILNSLQRANRHAQGGRDACSSTEQQITIHGCQDLSDLTYELLAEGAAVLWQCHEMPESCSKRVQLAVLVMRQYWEIAEASHRHLPTASMVSSKLLELTDEVLESLRDTSFTQTNAVPAPWRAATLVASRITPWLESYIWRETHWLWLKDSINARKVVHTTWGPPDEWNEKFGVHDCFSDAPLAPMGPRYIFSDLSGMRWELMAILLKDLYVSRGAREPLVVVEIGVFAGMLAYHLLKDLDFIYLIGVDPYVGSDGTFPGNFSDSLDPDIAMYKAMSVMEPYGPRANLLQMSSEAAAAEIDIEIDVIFVDGCHLYDCVQQDFNLWRPKLRRGVETLVAGHDFSPQWPGVVRAVHELRSGGQQVNVASDWMFWWHEERT